MTKLGVDTLHTDFCAYGLGKNELAIPGAGR